MFLKNKKVNDENMELAIKYYKFITVNVNNIFKSNIPLSSMTLPLGISFYTFQTLSYTIDVYKGRIRPEKNIINFAAFVTMFPQLIAGPIVKYTDIREKLISRKHNWSLVEEGVEDFIIGLGKKVLLANNFGMLWEEAQSIGFANISLHPFGTTLVFHTSLVASALLSSAH